VSAESAVDVAEKRACALNTPGMTFALCSDEGVSSMTTQWIGWSAVGVLTAIACSGAPSADTASKASPITPKTTASAAAPLSGSAGERPLSAEELDRLLDALEQEIGRQQVLP
jgi:hypothetical protein